MSATAETPEHKPKGDALRRVLEAVRAGCTQPAQVAAHAGMSGPNAKKRAKNRLHKLAEAGLVKAIPGPGDAKTWVIVEQVEPDREVKEVARDLFDALDSETWRSVERLARSTGDSEALVLVALRSLVDGTLGEVRPAPGGAVLARRSRAVVRRLGETS